MRLAQTQTLAATAAADQSYSVFFVFDGEQDVSAFETFLVLSAKKLRLGLALANLLNYDPAFSR